MPERLVLLFSDMIAVQAACIGTALEMFRCDEVAGVVTGVIHRIIREKIQDVNP